MYNALKIFFHNYLEFRFLLSYLCTPLKGQTVVVAQLVRASDCGSEGRGFEPLHPPKHKKRLQKQALFFVYTRSIFEVSVTKNRAG